MSSWVGRRLLTGSAVAVAGTVVFSGVAHADVNRVDSFVDGSANTITVTQSDTYINGVVPLDGNPLTREWFHNGRIAVTAAGAEASDFSGTVSVGYQFAYPMSIGGSINVSFNSPQATATVTQKTETVEPEDDTDPETPPVADEEDVTIQAAEDEAPEAVTRTTTTATGKVVIEAPQVASQLNIAPGPGLQEIEIASADVGGELSELQFAGIHGTTTGVLGNLTIRPYVKVTSDSGSYVVSYGDPQILS